MSGEKVGKRPPGAPAPESRHDPAPAKVDKKASSKAAKEPTPAASEAAADVYEPSAVVSAQLERRLQPLAEQMNAGRFKFSDKDLEYLANTFASIVSEHPQADRRKRTSLFVAAILSRMKKLCGEMTAAQKDLMRDIITDVIDSSPVIGQKVEEVTAEASKANP